MKGCRSITGDDFYRVYIMLEISEGVGGVSSLLSTRKV